MAILPFENAENDEAIDYLADGIVKILIREIARLPSMTVTNFHTVLRLKGQKVDVGTVGRTLHVDSILTGAVKRERWR